MGAVRDLREALKSRHGEYRISAHNGEEWEETIDAGVLGPQWAGLDASARCDFL